METGSESDGSLLGVDLNVSEGLVVVGGDDNVDGLDGSGERLVKLLLSDLQLEESSIDLVDDNDGLDSLSKSLPEDWGERGRGRGRRLRSNRSSSAEREERKAETHQSRSGHKHHRWYRRRRELHR